MSFDARLINQTPFAVTSLPTLDTRGQEALLVVLCATFCADGDRGFRPVAEQGPIHACDAYRASPGMSSLAVESDLAPYKPRVDVLLEGTVYAPGGAYSARVPVELAVGDIVKRAWVYGDRLMALGAPTEPVPFTSMPLCWERSYGGVSPRSGAHFRANPVGVGFDGATGVNGEELPNIEYPQGPLGGPGAAPAGFGPVARGWTPRAERAGTYDAAWREARWPLPPTDFDPLHHQAAPLDQQSDVIVGGEPVRLMNLTPDGVWSFALPRLHVPTSLRRDRGAESAVLRLDTVLFRPDERVVRLCARALLSSGRSNRIREVAIGHMLPGWHAAAASSRRYVDLSGSEGCDRGARSWSA